MLKIIKTQIKKLIFVVLLPISKTKIGQFISEKLFFLSMSNVKEIFYHDCRLKFITPNWVNRFRINTFSKAHLNQTTKHKNPNTNSKTPSK